MDRWVGFNEVPGEGDPPYGPQITAVDATGGPAVRGPFPIQDTGVLGWRDPDHLLNAVVGSGQGTTGLIVEISLVDGTFARVAAFATSGACINVILGDTCQTAAPMAATNLLPQLRVLLAAAHCGRNTTPCAILAVGGSQGYHQPPRSRATT
jgi:hypothetical protein